MGSQNETSARASSLFRQIVSSLSLDWFRLVFQIYCDIRRFLKNQSHEGLYEVLEYDAVLELTDPNGNAAIFKKHQKVKFLQDNIIAFQDHVWGDGEILSNYRCSPGVEVDRYQIGGRWNVLISLRETKSSGDTEDFYIQRKIIHGFTKSEEWWQTEMQHETRWLKVCIIFPKRRRCRRAVLMEKTQDRTTVLGPDHFADLPDGRQMLTWVNEKPRRFETYTIKWRW